jgi:hypothetical protein
VLVVVVVEAMRLLVAVLAVLVAVAVGNQQIKQLLVKVEQ